MIPTLRILWPFIAYQRVRLSWLLFLSVQLASLTALYPLPIKVLVDYALGGDAPPPLLAWLPGVDSPATLVIYAALASIGLFTLRTAIDSAIRWLWASAGQRMVLRLARDLFSDLLRLNGSFYARHTSGDLITRISSDAYCVYYASQGLLTTPLQSIFTLIAVSALAWQLDIALTLATLAVAPALAFTARFFGDRIKVQSRRQVEAGARVAAFVHQALSAIPVVQAFGMESSNRFQHAALAREVVQHSQKSSLYKNLLAMVASVIAAVGSGVVVYLGATRVLSGAITIGTLLVFVEYLRSMQGAFRQLLNVYTYLKTAEASVERVDEVLGSTERVVEAPDAPLLHPQSGAPAIEYAGVSFRYSSGARPALANIDLTIQCGECVAVVGASGAGKSTLASLIPRFFDCDEGVVRVFGNDIRSVQISSLRRQIGLVTQDPYILPLSVRENIAYARADASMEEIQTAAKLASADSFIDALEYGYDTVLSEHGATLSGGQRQRIALARAVLLDPPILILDEPTSALDVETEESVMDALYRVMAGRTTVVIAHRLSTLKRADRIIVLEEGEIVESGTHDTLMQTGGRYRDYFTLQQADAVQGEKP